MRGETGSGGAYSWGGWRRCTRSRRDRRRRRSVPRAGPAFPGGTRDIRGLRYRPRRECRLRRRTISYREFMRTPSCRGAALFHRPNADDPPVGAVVLEPHAPGNLREDRVVFSDAGVEAGPEASSPLAHDDRAAADEVAVVGLDAEPLGVGIAAVSRAALSFFVSHCCDPAGPEAAFRAYSRMAGIRTRVA